MPIDKAWSSATARQRRFMLRFVGMRTEVAEAWMNESWNALDGSVKVALMRHWRHNPQLVPGVQHAQAQPAH